jgi:hypothetical protein
MALIVNQEPNQYNQVKQTIPFVVYSNLFSTYGFDAIETSFKYLFEVRTMRTDGVYRTYSTVAIPPRPDNLTGFFDASPIISSAISQDLGTHIATGATRCPNSIIQFRVICTERYLTTGGTYTSGTPIVIGDYYGLNSGVNEQLTGTYLMSTTGSTIVPPLHRHFLLGDNLKLYKNEPMTLSWLTNPKISGNLLEEKHGDYGSFNKMNSLVDMYGSGMTINPTTVQFNAMNTVTPLGGTGKAFVMVTAGSYFTTGNTYGDWWTFDNVLCDNNKVYTYEIYVKIASTFASFNSNKMLKVRVSGTGITMNTQTIVPIYVAGILYSKLTATFTTTSTTSATITHYAQLTGAASAGNNLSDLNSRAIYYDSAMLYSRDATLTYLSGGDIEVNPGMASTITYAIPSPYFDDVVPVTDYSHARFDTPIGSFTNILNDGTKQNPNTGFYYDVNGNVGKSFRIKLKRSDGSIMGRSEPIYQDQDDCNRYDKLRVKWLNELGAWDYFTFDKVSSASTKIEREAYKITIGKFKANTSTGAYNYSESDSERGYKTLNLKQIDTFIMTSDWITEETAKHLQGMFTSSEVYLLNPEIFEKYVINDAYDIEYPIFLQDSEIQYQTNSPEQKLVNLTIKVSPANNFGDKTTNI